MTKAFEQSDNQTGWKQFMQIRGFQTVRLETKILRKAKGTGACWYSKHNRKLVFVV